ncbi:hypothetical protein, partial [Streptomyces sp. NPDC056730]|uniref:hypothetical protein n=1 Tax=Streptomyces sp. NPDC056730 TaxID=3345929 RepID=UPI0036D0B1AF
MPVLVSPRRGVGDSRTPVMESAHLHDVRPLLDDSPGEGEGLGLVAVGWVLSVAGQQCAQGAEIQVE